MSAKYEEAVATLRRRFGNTQLIVSKHMDALLNLPAVTSHYDLRGLRHLYDSVEAHVRGLRALGVPAESYGGLLEQVAIRDTTHHQSGTHRGEVGYGEVDEDY